MSANDVFTISVEISDATMEMQATIKTREKDIVTHFNMDPKCYTVPARAKDYHNWLGGS